MQARQKAISKLKLDAENEGESGTQRLDAEWENLLPTHLRM